MSNQFGNDQNPSPSPQTPEAIAEALITHFEGRKNRIYCDRCGKIVEEHIKPDGSIHICPGGTWTIGIGHALLKGEFEQFRRGIGTDKVQLLFFQDFIKAQRAVNSMVHVPLKPAQWAALVSFVFNLGDSALASSTLLRKINAGASTASIIAEFERWDHSNGEILPGLQARRRSEAFLWDGGTIELLKIKNWFQPRAGSY